MRFLRLSNYVINPKYINKIEINTTKNKIIVNVLSTSFSGFISGVYISGVGYIGSNDISYSFSRETNENDYNKILKWIEENTI